MEEKRTSNKSLMAVSLLLLSVVAILIVLFVLRPTEAREGIVLPDPQTEPAQEQVQQQPNAGGFLELNAENVIRVLDSLNKPEYYRQTFSVTVDSGKTASERIVEIWVNGSWIHGEVRDGSSVKSVFSDGTEAWIWYNHDLQPAVFPLSQNLLLEDLLGIPNFDYQNTLRKAELLDAGYAYREEDLLQYVYVQTTAPSAAEWEFRFALDTGLLYSCSVSERNLKTYSVEQTAFEQLAYGDQAFEGRFCLPDGTVPFTEETRMLLP